MEANAPVLPGDAGAQTRVVRMVFFLILFSLPHRTTRFAPCQVNHG